MITARKGVKKETANKFEQAFDKRILIEPIIKK